MSPHLDQIKVGQSIKEGPSTVEKADVQQVAASHLHSKKAIYEDAFVLVNAHGEAGEHAERKLIRKVDWFLMPLFYDKAVIGHAAVFGLRADLGLENGLKYSETSIILYVGCIVGAYPMTYLVQRYPAAKVCSTLVATWSIVVLCTPACTSYAGIMVNRFVLGLLESAITPAFMLITGMWYTKQEQALRSSIWYSFSGGSNLISPVINWGLGHITGGPLKSWQWMFLVAGVVTLVWGVALWFIFPDNPVYARGFSEEERAWLLQRTRRNNAGAENPKFLSYQFRECILSLHFWGLFLITLLVVTGGGTIAVFSSIIFKGMGFNKYESLLLNIPQGAIAFISILGSGWLGRKLPNARYHLISIGCMPVILGCCLLWQLPTASYGARIFGEYCLVLFSWPWTQCIGLGTSNVAGSTKKSTMAAGVFIAYCIGSIAGPLLFDAKYAPRYDLSFSVLLAFYCVAALLAQLVRFHLKRENDRRDREYGPPSDLHGLEDRTDRENTNFRYSL
ncbi:hypothetical protein ACEPPN_015296 [Leptodophora sp. 'Broadleaf-Isolate-01']